MLTSLARAAAVATLGITVLPAPAASQVADPCAGRSACVATTPFAAIVTDVRTSTSGAARYVTVVVRFENRTGRPLILGYVNRSQIIIDDEGNRYAPYGQVRGIGAVSGSSFDPAFRLEPGESGDTRFEFSWHGGNRIAGTRYDVELAVREIDPAPGNQFRIGREHALQYRGLSPSTTLAAAGADALVAPGPTPAPAPAPENDSCARLANCHHAGPFLAQVTQVTTSKTGTRQGNQSVRMTIRIRNLGSEPLILAYRTGSGLLIDDQGNRYTSSSGEANRIRGIGIVTARAADPQFVLRPGEARDATVEVGFYYYPRHTLGTIYTYDLTLEQLEILPSRQVRSVRQYAVSFTNLREGRTPVADGPARGLGRLIEEIRGRP